VVGVIGIIVFFSVSVVGVIGIIVFYDDFAVILRIWKPQKPEIARKSSGCITLIR